MDRAPERLCIHPMGILREAALVLCRWLRALTSPLWRLVRSGLGWPAPPLGDEMASEGMALVDARTEPATPDPDLVHPLDAERDSKLPPGAPWHLARLARVPVPGE
eukprot:502641-Amphidinium_carterae.2